MSLPGETISDGAAPRCDDCGRMPKLDVYLSGGGYYIGTYCACGPYTRESATTALASSPRPTLTKAATAAERQLNLGCVREQWDDGDFEPIAQAFDDLFRSMALLNR